MRIITNLTSCTFAGIHRNLSSKRWGLAQTSLYSCLDFVESEAQSAEKYVDYQQILACGKGKQAGRDVLNLEKWSEAWLWGNRYGLCCRN